MSAMLNGMSIVSESSPQGSQTDTLTERPSSLTCVSSYSPVQPSNTEELRTWLAQAFHVSHSAQRESSKVLTTKGICGQQPQMSFAWFDPLTSSWRMSQGCLLADTQESLSETWPQWGMWADGAAYELQRPELSTIEPDGGWLPTPTATDHKRTPMKMTYATKPETEGAPDDLAKWALRESGLPHGRLEPALWEWAMVWPLTWTELKPLETDKFQQWLDAHGNS